MAIALAVGGVWTSAVYGDDPLPQVGWHVRLRDDAALNAVWVGNGGRIWAVGDSGAIFASHDGGDTWHTQQSGTSVRLLDVQFVDERVGWIVGGWVEPDSRLSRGLLLTTRDGGAHWQRLPAALPRMCALDFETQTRGWVAGDWSSAHLTSFFETSDGGKSFQPATASDLGPVISGAAADSDIAVLRSGVAVSRAERHRAFQPLAADRSFRTVAATDDAVAFAGGSHVAIKPFDAPLQFETPDSALTGYDLRRVAFHRDRLWAAGLCQGRLWFRQSGRWSAVATGFVGTVNDVHGAADGTIAAVGSCGQILISRDFGNRWHMSRGAERGVAALVVAKSIESMPLATVAQLAGRDNARVVMASTPAEVSDDPLAVDSAEVLRDVALAVGAAEHIAIRDESEEEPTPTKASGGVSEATILNVLRSYEPRVVLLAADLDEEEKSRWRRGCSNLSSAPGILEQNRGSAGSVVVHPHAALPALGNTVAALVADARALLALPYTADEKEAWISTGASGLAGSAEELLPANVRMNDRMLRAPAAGSQRYLGMVQARTKYPQLVENLFSGANDAEDADAFATRLSSLVDKLPDEHHDEILRLALRTAAQRDLSRHWRATVELASRRRRESGIGRRALLQKRAIEDSDEWRQIFAAPRGVAVASFTGPAPITAPRSPFEHRDRQRHGDRLQKDPVQPQVSEAGSPRMDDLDLLFQEHPAQLFVSREFTPAHMQRWRTSASAGPWSELVTARIPETEGLNRLEVRFAGGRPGLDGRLEESMWQTLDQEPRAPESGPELALAYDSEFLLIAARFEATQAAVSSQARVRDAPLDDAQRLLIQLDTDADLLTSFRLEIDAAGRTRDSCDGFLHWQPRWYVATSRDDAGRVTIEAAVHRASLADLPPVPGDRWLVRARMLEPGTRMAVGPDWQAEGWRVALFR